jgi:hypothetical protein
MAGNRRPVLGIYPDCASLGEGRRRLQAEDSPGLPPGKPRSNAEVTMAARMKRRHRIGELVARLLDRRSGGTAPGRPSGQGPSGTQT